MIKQGEFNEYQTGNFLYDGFALMAGTLNVKAAAPIDPEIYNS